MGKRKHPMQPVVYVGDVIRFQANPVVQYLLDNGGINMNDLALITFDDDDRMQFAQLIGYSVSGFGDLDYAAKEVVEAADLKAEKLHAKMKRAA